MTVVSIDIRNIAGETHPDDRVVVYSPAERSVAGQIISTAVEVISLTDGQATRDLRHGPVVVRIEALGVADTREKIGYIPKAVEGADPISLADVIQDWTPALVDQGILAILIAVERAVLAVERSADDSSVAHVTSGKNLYYPAADTLGAYVADGQEISLAGYRTTDFIPVTPGESYALSVARHVNFYDGEQTYLSGSWKQWNPAAPVVITAPAGAVYLRMSWAPSAAYPVATTQIEQGNTHTPYEPWRKFLEESIVIPEVADMQSLITQRPTVSEVTELVHVAVDDATADVARIVQGKNLYNPSTDLEGYYLFPTGQPQPLAGYRLTDFISVAPGEPYALSVARAWGFFSSNRTLISGSYQNVTQAPQVVTAPAGAAYLRVSYSVGVHTPETVQIEHGSVHTVYEPYARMLDPTITVQSAPIASAGPIQVTRSGDTLTVSSDLGDQVIIQGVNLAMGRNKVMNFSRLQYGAIDQVLNDDVAPIRTTQGTVGANHGLAGMGRWAAGTHDKSVEDVGSQWTDGTYTYAVIHLDDDGDLWVGRARELRSGGESVFYTVNPIADLTHVAGATNQGPLQASEMVVDQLAPWLQRHRKTVKLDGVPVGEGTSRGTVLTVRESYEILDYGEIWDWVTTHVGEKYLSVHQRAGVGVETEWEFHPGGKVRHRTSLREISPTRLGNCGFMQAVALPGDVTRYLPGVGVIGGQVWDSGVSLESLTSNLKVTSADLLDSVPPTMAVDVRSDLALAIGLTPWEGESESTKHLDASPENLWDLRSTKKIYPNITGTLMPGWGRISVEGIRAYLTPDEASAVTADADPASAWVTLDQMTG